MKRILIVLMFVFSIICNSEETNNHSKIVMDVIKMVDNNVSTDIIKSYVNTIRIIPVITPDDIILLTQKSVKNDIIELLIVKNGESRKIIEQFISEKEYRESYTYFYKMYLLPRSLSKSRQYYKKF